MSIETKDVFKKNLESKKYIPIIPATYITEINKTSKYKYFLVIIF
tara:strand:- start:884 stop:1018 length:135 start_codon:yes stop_codon:yes gene_type:complete